MRVCSGSFSLHGRDWLELEPIPSWPLPLYPHENNWGEREREIGGRKGGGREGGREGGRGE